MAGTQSETKVKPSALTQPLTVGLPSSERTTVVQTLSPAWLRGIEQDADKGRPRNLINFMDVSRRSDDRIGQCAGRREAAVASLEWSVQAGYPSDATDAQIQRGTEIAAVARGVLERLTYHPVPGSDIGAGGFSDFLRHLETSSFYGWAPSELEWEYLDGRWDPIRAGYCHPRRIAWDTSMSPRLYDPGSSGPSGQYPGMELEPLRWIVDRGMVTPGYPTQDGLGRLAVWLYAYKSFAWKDFIQYSEQFGTPFLLGTINGGTGADTGPHSDDADRQRKLYEVISRFSGLKRAVIDGRDKIDVIQPESNAKHIAPVELVGLVNDGLAIHFLGATQAVDVGDHGTYASAKVHEGVELRLVAQDAEHRSNSITGLLRGWYDLNFADGPEYRPRFWLNADEPADLAKDLAKYQGLYDMGLSLSKAELYEHFGVEKPATEEGEEEEDDALVKSSGGGSMFPFPEGTETRARPRSPVILGGKPDDLGDDIEGEVTEAYEGNIQEYSKVADRAGRAARTEALDEATIWIKDKSTDPGVRAFAEEIYDTLSPAYAKTMSKGKFRPVVEAIYERYKLDSLGWPKGVSFDFSGTDLLFADTLGEIDTVYMSKYIENERAASSVKRFLRDWYGENHGDIFGKRTKAETIADFRRLLGKNLEHVHDWQVRRIINTSVARVRGYAEVKQMHDMLVEEMQWHANSAERVMCGVCKRLHGTVVRVERVYTHAVKEMELGPDTYIKSLKNRAKVHPLTADVLERLSNEAKAKYFETYGWQIPVHPNCACMWIVRILS